MQSASLALEACPFACAGKLRQLINFIQVVAPIPVAYNVALPDSRFAQRVEVVFSYATRLSVDIFAPPEWCVQPAWISLLARSSKVRLVLHVNPPPAGMTKSLPHLVHVPHAAVSATTFRGCFTAPFGPGY